MYKLIPLLFVCLSGCSSEPAKFDKPPVYLSQDTQINKTRQDALKFFSENPIYFYSPQKESELYAEFMRVINIKDNRKMSMYDALMLAHKNLQ